jgi:hypothetical protein
MPWGTDQIGSAMTIAAAISRRPVVVVERGGRGGSRPLLEGVLPQVRPRTHYPLPEANPGLDHSSVQTPRTSRPVDLVGLGRLRPAQAGAHLGHRQKAAVGACATAPAFDPDPRVEEFRNTPGDGEHSSGSSETLREIPRTPEGQPLGTGQAPSDAQNGRLSRPEKLRSQLRARFAVLRITNSA